jgi:hypothetical protein
MAEKLIRKSPEGYFKNLAFVWLLTQFFSPEQLSKPRISSKGTIYSVSKIYGDNRGIHKGRNISWKRR